jgi:hypothetical protein
MTGNEVEASGASKVAREGRREEDVKVQSCEKYELLKKLSLCR